MLRERLPLRGLPKRRFEVELARNTADVWAAQRLRYEVFAQEMGARLATSIEGVDEDRLDAYCEHLLVREAERGEVVGTYRILSPAAANRAGGYYSEQEFDLTRLTGLRADLVEVGRSCIHPHYRTGGVISLLWAGLARYMLAHGYGHLMGCASISMVDGGHMAAALYRRIAAAAMSPAKYRVVPRCALPLEQLTRESAAELPPLLKGYLRLGAWVCGAPAWDADFNTADLLVLLPLTRVSARYARHYIGDSIDASVGDAPAGSSDIAAAT
jgi:putative hemolysin